MIAEMLTKTTLNAYCPEFHQPAREQFLTKFQSRQVTMNGPTSGAIEELGNS
jgi:hypothetical protein